MTTQDMLADSLMKSINDGEYIQGKQLIEDYEAEYELNDILAVLAATIYQELKDPPRVLDHILRGLKSNPYNYELYLMLGNYYAERNPDMAYLSYENSIYYCRKQNGNTYEASEDYQFLKSVLDEFVCSHSIRVRPVSIVILPSHTSAYLDICIGGIMESCAPETYELIIMDHESGSFHKNSEQKRIDPHNDILLLHNNMFLLPNSLYNLRMTLYSSNEIGIVEGVTNHNGVHSTVIQTSDRLEDHYCYAMDNNIPDIERVNAISELTEGVLLIRQDLAKNNTECLYDDTISGHIEARIIRQVSECDAKCVRCNNSYIYQFEEKEHVTYPVKTQADIIRMFNRPEKKILILKGDSLFGVLRKAADEVAKGFEDMGYQVDAIDLNAEYSQSVFDQIEQAEYSFIFSCQAVLFELESNGVDFLSRLHSPYIGWIFDDVLYHYGRVKRAHYPYIAMYAIDEMSVEAASMMFPDVRNIYYLPHGGFEYDASIEDQTGDKDIDILFPGNLSQQPDIESYGFSSEETYLAESMLEYMELNPTVEPRSALFYVMDSIDCKVDSEILIGCSRVLYYVDSYVRSKCRTDILKTLLDSEYRICAIGQGYDGISDSYQGRLEVVNGLDISETVKMIRRAKILIDPMYPIFEKGMHERIYTAMLQKTAVFTPYTEYKDINLGKRIEYINLHNYPAMLDRIGWVMDHYDNYSRTILEDNYRYALQEHTWRVRGWKIIEQFEAGELMPLN